MSQVSAPQLSVPFVDLERAHRPIAGELRAAFDGVLARSAFVLGDEVEAFEREFATYCEAREAVGVASGTAALELALRAAGIGAGDEVIVPAHTYIASALAVLHAGATPVLCDVDEATGTIDAASAAGVVSSTTAAILPVHLYGQCADMDAVGSLAARHGLFVLEDAAQAHGARWRGRRAGSLGNAAAFSFYPSKNLGALGDGGAVCTADSELAGRVRALRDLGQRTKGEHAELGFNQRLDGLQAALLRVKLRGLDEANAARVAHARDFSRLLPSSVRRLDERPEASCVHHLLPVRVGDRDGVRQRLGDRGVGTGVHYFPALHDQPPLRALPTPRTSLVHAEAWAANELSLPMFAQLTADEIEWAAGAVAAAVGEEAAA